MDYLINENDFNKNEQAIVINNQNATHNYLYKNTRRSQSSVVLSSRISEINNNENLTKNDNTSYLDYFAKIDEYLFYIDDIIKNYTDEFSKNDYNELRSEIIQEKNYLGQIYYAIKIKENEYDNVNNEDCSYLFRIEGINSSIRNANNLIKKTRDFWDFEELKRNKQIISEKIKLFLPIIDFIENKKKIKRELLDLKEGFEYRSKEVVFYIFERLNQIRDVIQENNKVNCNISQEETCDPLLANYKNQENTKFNSIEINNEEMMNKIYDNNTSNIQNDISKNIEMFEFSAIYDEDVKKKEDNSSSSNNKFSSDINNKDFDNQIKNIDPQMEIKRNSKELKNLENRPIRVSRVYHEDLKKFNIEENNSNQTKNNHSENNETERTVSNIEDDNKSENLKDSDKNTIGIINEIDANPKYDKDIIKKLSFSNKKSQFSNVNIIDIDISMFTKNKENEIVQNSQKVSNEINFNNNTPTKIIKISKKDSINMNYSINEIKKGNEIKKLNNGNNLKKKGDIVNKLPNPPQPFKNISKNKYLNISNITNISFDLDKNDKVKKNNKLEIPNLSNSPFNKVYKGYSVKNTFMSKSPIRTSATNLKSNLNKNTNDKNLNDLKSSKLFENVKYSGKNLLRNSVEKEFDRSPKNKNSNFKFENMAIKSLKKGIINLNTSNQIKNPAIENNYNQFNKNISKNNFEKSIINSNIEKKFYNLTNSTKNINSSNIKKETQKLFPSYNVKNYFEKLVKKTLKPLNNGTLNLKCEEYENTRKRINKKSFVSSLKSTPLTNKENIIERSPFSKNKTTNRDSMIFNISNINSAGLNNENKNNRSSLRINNRELDVKVDKMILVKKNEKINLNYSIDKKYEFSQSPLRKKNNLSNKTKSNIQFNTIKEIMSENKRIENDKKKSK